MDKPKFIKCPTEDCVNFCDERDGVCAVCKEKENGFIGGSKNMNATMVHFVFKRGISPEKKADIKELRVYKGVDYILVYDKGSRCVGVVFSHDEKGAPAHAQAEIGFFEQYRKEYGQWHRTCRDGRRDDRIRYDWLQQYLTENNEYHYTAYLNFVKIDD